MIDEQEYIETHAREIALAKFLGIGEVTEIRDEGDNLFSYGREEYYVLTDEEADEKAREYIKNSIWAFKPSFLSYYTNMDEECISIIQEKKYESCNDMFLRLVDDRFDRLVNDAIASDGRGHFIANYDFEENEEGNYFIYRNN